MALPITGPFTTEYESNWDSGYPMNLKFGRSFRQRRPYDKPLPYSYINRITHQVSDWPFLQTHRASGGIDSTQAFDVPTRSRFNGSSSWIEDQLAEVRNRALRKVTDQVNDPASMLTNLVESSQSLAMVTSKLEAFNRFRRDWVRGNHRKAILDILSEQKFRNRGKEARRKRRLRRLAERPRTTPATKSLASGWVETWFGWLPTIGDVQKSLTNLSRDFPMETFSGSSAKEYVLAGGASGSHRGRFFARFGVSVQVTNPNLYLASQLGLTNPVYTAFEVLPYSWLLAWFGNLEQFFRQFSTFHGTTTVDSWYTQGCADFNQFDWSSVPWSTRPKGSSSCVSFERQIGIPDVTLQFKGLKRLSVTRGLTLTSLLTLRLSDDVARFKLS